MAKINIIYELTESGIRKGLSVDDQISFKEFADLICLTENKPSEGFYVVLSTDNAITNAIFVEENLKSCGIKNGDTFNCTANNPEPDDSDSAEAPGE